MTIVLDWREQRNALDPANGDELQAALRAAASHEDVCGVVLTGEGAFCAGGNLKGAQERAAMSPQERRAMITKSFQGIIRTLLDLPVPTVAAIDGPAVGEGTARARGQQRMASLSEIGRPALQGYVELDRSERRQRMDAHLEAVLDTQTRLLYRPGFNDRAAGALGS